MRKSLFLLLVITIFSIQSAMAVPETQMRSSGLGEAGCRAIGMGEAYIALSDDPSGIFWNPAGLGKIPIGKAAVDIMFKANLRNEMTYDSMSFIGQTYEADNKVKFTISEYLNNRLEPPVSGKKLNYTYGLGAIFSDGNDGYKMNDIHFAVGKRVDTLYRKLNTSVYAGVKARFTHYANFLDKDNKLVTFDENSLGVGAIYQFSEFLDVGMTIDNILKSSPYDVPVVFSLGLALHIDPTTIIAMDGYNIIDSKNVNDNGDDAEFRVGIEKKFIDNDLTVRLGSKNGNMNMGFGMQLTENFKVDYAYMADYNSDIQQHFMGGQLRF